MKHSNESAVEISEMIFPRDANAMGNAFGGWVFSKMDMAALICSQRHAGNECVTVAVDSLRFYLPSVVGAVLSVKAMINYTSRTSCEVGVEVMAENSLSGIRQRAASAFFTMVALDSEKRPTPIPGLLVETDDEKKRFEEAKARREKRH